MGTGSKRSRRQQLLVLLARVLVPRESFRQRRWRLMSRLSR
jgi:hypothetical protein